MASRVLWKVLTVLIVLTMAVPFVQAAPVEGEGPAPPDLVEQDRPSPPGWARDGGAEQVSELSHELAMSKIDPLLRDAAETGGKEMIDLYVAVQEGTDLSAHMSEAIVRPPVFGGVQHIYGKTAAGKLIKIAQLPDVVALVKIGPEMEDKPFDPETQDSTHRADLQARIRELRANEVNHAEAQMEAADVGPQGWYDVLDGHKSGEAWDKGFTGEGVIVGVLDDGIDFAHPDLQGTYARVTDPTSPYYGWPMAFSYVSMLYFVNDVWAGTDYLASNAAGSRWADTQTTVEAHSEFEGGTAKVMYQPVGSGIAHEYTIPTTGKSSFYKLGSLPEKNLFDLYGEHVAILVADEHVAGIYDTVYVDLDNDYDFTDEKPVTKSSPEVYRDMDGDGYADISGGLLVWISNGTNTPPTADWLWGVTCADQSATMKGCPDSGELLLFAGPFDGGYTHGTQCASNIAGQGVVNGGLTAQPFREGGMVQGAAPNVGLMDFGNHYYAGTDEDEYIVAALGYDGVPNSGDEVQITSNSYGSFRQMWGGWGYYGRLVTALNTSIAPSTTWIFSAGNEGPGYGPQEGDGGPTTIQAGSSTQYGSTNWDSIVSADQIVHGDVTAFFSHGPNRDGSSGLDVLANGGRGAGDEGLNYYGFDGWTSWATWGGTSRSGPVAAGNLALVYEAFKARHGRWPTWAEAKALLKSGASNASGSPFFQGAGVVNADRATDLAAGIYGVYAAPDEWQVGDWKGAEYLNFANVAHPGETYTKTYTVKNPSGHDITVDISEGVMEKIDSAELTFTTSDEDEESGFNFHAPDYLMELDESMIPADTEVMIVRYVHPYDTFDAAMDFTPNPNSSWRYLFYSWTDVNRDGKLWEDRDGNGVVNHVDDLALGMDNDGFFRPDYDDPETEIQQGEYVRLDYDFGGSTDMLVVRNPLERVADGYFFGFQHRFNDGSVPQTTFKIGLEFYKRADWAWLDLSDSSLMVPAEGQAHYDAVMSIPSDAAPGVYEGVIFLNDPGDLHHDGHETTLPVVANVIADIPDGGSVTLGGDGMADTMYQNSWTNGYFNWYGGGWTGAGDWRHYFLNVDSEDLSNKNLLVHTSWEDYPTDFNTWILGPTEDCASNGADPCAWFTPWTNLPDPGVFGPYTLQPIGASDTFLAGAAYPFHTSTGGPDDWVKVPLEREGLHEIALHNVLFNGEDLAEQFQVDVGTLDFDAAMDPDMGTVNTGSVDAVAYTETGRIDLQFTPTLELPDLSATLAGGLSTSHEDHVTTLIDSDECNDGAWCAETQWVTVTVDAQGATELFVYVNVPDGEDIDLYIYRDVNGNGVADAGVDDFVGSSTDPAGSDDNVRVGHPSQGTYLIGLLGWDLTTPTLDTSWYHEITAPGPLPTETVQVSSDTVTVDQDAKFDPTTSSYSTTVMVNERTSILHAMVEQVPAGADVDLYVTDSEGAIIGKSQNGAGVDEHVDIAPTEPDYRLQDGDEYTFWVHGYDVTGTITPTVRIWYDSLNVWLSATHPAVSVSSVGAGEMVSVTLHFDKEGWDPGDPILSARLLASPSVIPNAFDELVTITRQDPPPTEPQPDAAFSKSFTAERGPSSYSHNGYPTALANVGDTITFTLEIENTGDATGTYYAEDWILPDWQLFDSFVVTPTVYSWGVDPFGIGFDVLAFTDTLGVGESLQVVYRVKAQNPMGDLGYVVPNYLDVYDGDTGAYYGGDVNYLYYRSFRTDGSYKMSNPGTVAPGETFTYEMSLTNPSSEDEHVYFSDPLPNDVSFISVTGGAAYNATDHTVTWSGLLPGTTLSTVDFDIVVAADSGLADGTIIENEATLAFKLGGTPFTTLEAATMIDDGISPALRIDKKVDTLVAYHGETLGYTIVFKNAGTEAATGVTVADEIPAYVTVDADSLMADLGFGPIPLPDEVWDEETRTVAYAAPLPVQPGQIVTVTFDAEVDDDAPVDWAIINPVVANASNAGTAFDTALTEVLVHSRTYLPLIVRNYPKTITVLHTSDEHGWLLPNVPFGSDVTEGGVASLMGRLTQNEGYSPDDDSFLLLSAGDNWTGPSISTWFEGEPVVEVMNAMGYDVSVIGNHEFDFGRDTLDQRIAEADFPFLSANIYYSGTTSIPDFATPYVIKEVNGVDVGIIGLSTTETPETTHPKNITDLTFGDYETALRREVPKMRADGADLIILQAHVCSDELVPLAGAVSDLDIALMEGGHCHETFTGQVGDTLILEGHWAWRAYGKTQLFIDPVTYEVLDYTQEIVMNEYVTDEGNPVTPDPAIEAIVETWEDAVDDEMGEVIGYTQEGITRRSWEQANYVTDSWLWAYGTADIAMTNWGGLRADIPAGDITVGDVVGVLPFENRIVDCTITGAEVIDNLECCGGVAIAGITYTYYEDGGMRVVDAVTLTNGSPLVVTHTYSVLVNDFMYAGGDGFLFGSQDTDAYDTGIQWRQPVIDWTVAQNTSAGNPIDPLLDDEPRAIEITP